MSTRALNQCNSPNRGGQGGNELHYKHTTGRRRYVNRGQCFYSTWPYLGSGKSIANYSDIIDQNRFSKEIFSQFDVLWGNKSPT